jgi:hypothetical protein
MTFLVVVLFGVGSLLVMSAFGDRNGDEVSLRDTFYALIHNQPIRAAPTPSPTTTPKTGGSGAGGAF